MWASLGQSLLRFQGKSWLAQRLLHFSELRRLALLSCLSPVVLDLISDIPRISLTYTKRALGTLMTPSFPGQKKVGETIETSILHHPSHMSPKCWFRPVDGRHVLHHQGEASSRGRHDQHDQQEGRRVCEP